MDSVNAKEEGAAVTLAVGCNLLLEKLVEVEFSIVQQARRVCLHH